MDPRKAADPERVASAFPHAAERPEATLSVDDLRKVPVFEKVSDAVLKKIQPYVLEARYAGGDLILREGEYSDAAYYIVSGVIEIQLSRMPPAGRTLLTRTSGRERRRHRAAELAATGPRDHAIGRALVDSRTIILSDIPAEIRSGEVAFLERGEVFGEISALSRYPVSATVHARSDVLCLLIRTP